MMKPQIEIEIVRPRRSGARMTRLAVRATLTSIVAFVAAYVVQTMAMPALDKQFTETANQLPAYVRWLPELRGWLMFLPVPGLVLGIASIILRPMRPLLVPLALLTSVLAVAAIVGVLVASIAPMYQIPADLQQLGG